MILNTSAKNFTTWLRNRPLYEERQEHPSGELILWVQPARVRTTSRGTLLVERHGEHWIRSPDPGGGPWRKEQLGTVIWFDVLTLDDEKSKKRIEVISDCDDTGALLIYMTLLARIAETWPGAQAEVLAYLEEMSEASTTGIEWWDQQVNEAAKTLEAQLLEAEEPKPHPDASETGGAEAGGEAVGELHPALTKFAHGELDYGELVSQIPEIETLRNAQNKYRSTVTKYIRLAILYRESGKGFTQFVVDWNIEADEQGGEGLSETTLDRAKDFLTAILTQIGSKSGANRE